MHYIGRLLLGRRPYAVLLYPAAARSRRRGGVPLAAERPEREHEREEKEEGGRKAHASIEHPQGSTVKNLQGRRRARGDG